MEDVQLEKVRERNTEQELKAEVVQILPHGRTHR